jgi:16S rRNA (guanine527-N7)-methyltransferase
MKDSRAHLQTGLDALALSLNEQQTQQLLAFIKLIEKWNKAYNLTAIKTQQAMVSLHLLDSLAINPYIQGNRVIDIGTGAGLPGIPLAIARPEMEFTLLDSNAKKTRFVQQAILELKLRNVRVIHDRVEAFRPEQKFDQIVSRAFTNLADMIQLTRHLLNEKGVLLAMKGKVQVAEMQHLAAEFVVIPLQVPGVEADRCLIKIISLA